MCKNRFRSAWPLTLILLVFLGGISAPVIAASAEESLSGDVLAILDRAMDREDPGFLIVAVTLAIEAAPENRAAILLYVELEAPNFSAAVEASLMQPDALPELPAAVAEVAEPDEEPEPPITGFVGLDGWEGELTLGISTNTGDTKDFDLDFSAKAVRDGESWRQTWTGRVEYESETKRTTEQHFLVEQQTDYKISERGYVFGNFRYRDERFSGYDYRLSGVIGYGYSVLKSEKLLWNLEAAPGFRLNKLQETNELEGEIIGRAASSFSWDIKDDIKLTNATSFLLGSDTSTLENDTALTLRISARLSGRVGYLVEYETNPPEGAASTNTTSKLSLVYGF